MSTLESATESLRVAQAAALGALETAVALARARAKEQTARIRKEHDRAIAVARNRAAQSVTEHTLAARDASPKRPTATDPLAVADHIPLGTLHASGARAGVNTDIEAPLIVPLVGRSNLVVIGGDGKDIARTAIWEALDRTGPGQLDVIGFDPLLTGALAPFAPLRGVGEDLLVVHNRAHDLEREVARLTADVQRVNDTLRGASDSLVDFRTKTGHAVERFQLVVLLDYPNGIEEPTHRQILALAKAGPAAGISFVIQTDPRQPVPDWWRAADLDPLGNTLVGRGGTLSWTAHPAFTVRTASEGAATLAADVDALVERVANASAPSVAFDDVQQTTARWTQSSTDGLRFAIGRSGQHVTEITLGDEREQRHNALITGAVGQGKSNLLKVVIHSLGQRYSPDELEMYLLDFKEGVTLYPFAPTPGAPEYLPHARVLGLESDRDFGLAVLRHLEAEFARRAKLFRPHGDNIAKYRAAVPDTRMPRIVLIVDEFHMLFDPADRTADEAAQLLETLARKGRSYGVHIVLASQTISGITALMTRENGIFAQFPIRLALKNNLAESYATLTQGNDGAARLRVRGEAVLNLDYGASGANRPTIVAAADDGALGALRNAWWTHARENAAPPMVFDGSRLIRPTAVIPMLRRLRRRVVEESAAPAAIVGLPIAVDDEPLTVSLPADPGRNLAILGAGERAGAQSTDDEAANNAIGVLQTAAVSLALQHPRGDAEFVALDCLDERAAARNHQQGWLDLMERLGFPVERVARAEIGTYLQALSEELAVREPGAARRYLLGFGLDRADLDKTDMFAHRAAEDLQTVLRDGASRGVHLLGWWASTASFKSHIGFSGEGYIEALLVLRLDERATQDILGPFVTWSVRDNRGLLTDRTQLSEPTTIIPFSPLEPRDAIALLGAEWGV